MKYPSPVSIARPTLRRLFSSVVFSGSLALGAISLPSACATSVTLTEAMLSDTSLPGGTGVIDFSGATIGHGTHAIPNTLAPGDTVFIAAQTRSRLVFKSLTQGTAANPITITNSGGQVVVQMASPSDYTAKGINLAGCQHVILKGTPGAGYTYGIKVASTAANMMGVKVGDNYTAANLIGSIDVTITGLEIANTGFAGIQAKCETAMPAGYVMDGLKIYGNYVHDTTGEGMYIGWVPNDHHDLANVEIHHNLLENVGWDGIQVNNCPVNASVHDNTILGYGGKSNAYNPYTWQNEGIGNFDNSEAVVYNNWVEADNQYSGSGIFLRAYKTSKVYNNILINKVVYASGNPVEAAIYVDNSLVLAPLAGAQYDIANNTIVYNGGVGVSNASSLPMVFVNNILAGPRYGSANTTGTMTQSNNLFVATFAGAGFVNDSTNDYHLASGSAAIDAGTSTSSYGVTTDYDAVSRPQGAAYDIGAYENASAAPASGILAPTAFGQAGTAYCPATGAFDAPPTWNATTQAPVGDDPVPHSNTTTNYNNRYWYVDFGTDFAKVRITGCWTRYRPSSAGSYAGLGVRFWSGTVTTTPTAMTETAINFGTAQNLPSSASQLWVRDTDLDATPFTPPARYLIINTGTPAASARSNEFTFIGYRLP